MISSTRCLRSARGFRWTTNCPIFGPPEYRGGRSAHRRDQRFYIRIGTDDVRDLLLVFRHLRTKLVP